MLQVTKNDSLGVFAFLAVSALVSCGASLRRLPGVPEGIRNPLGAPHALNHPSSNILPVFAVGYLLNLTFHDLSTSHLVNLLNLTCERVFP
jgi:hypothetical protein